MELTNVVHKSAHPPPAHVNMTTEQPAAHRHRAGCPLGPGAPPLHIFDLRFREAEHFHLHFDTERWA